jgi:uroporphyrinogen-III synthase
LFAGAARPGGGSTYALTWFGSARDPQAVAEAASMVAAELISRVQLQPRAVLDTRPEVGALETLLLNRSGNRVVHVPTVAIAPLAERRDLDRARGALDTYDWVVLTSKRGVDALFDGLQQELPRSVRWAAVGPTTAKALRERGVDVDAEPAIAVGEAIPAAMAEGGPLRGSRVLLARADSAAASLPDLLRRSGADVDDVVAYHSVTAPDSSRRPLAEALADPALEGVIFASGSAVRGLVELGGAGLARARRLKVFTIGPKTSAVAREHGFVVTAEAPTPDAAGIDAAVRSGLEREVARWVESQFPTSC